jgi:hypothetical protein
VIGVFADPYPDELFYSICARTCKRAGYSSHRSAMRDLFGYEVFTPSIVFPGHLDDLVARLPPESAYTSQYFIAEHTLLPFYQPFFPPERLSRFRQERDERKGASLHVLSGMAILLPEWLRFCPLCVEEDKRRYGECYWHRIHQISGVEICPLHEVHLCGSSARARSQATREKLVAAEDAIRWTELQQSSTQSPYHQILLALARDADFLLQSNHLSEEPAFLHQRYRKLLSERDLATYRGRVDISLLLQQFRNCYPPHLLQLLHCELDEQVQFTWLHRLVRSRKSAQHPLHHLLLIHFLGYTAEDFFGISVEKKPFGDAPWPCLNPICEKSGQLCIREYQVIHSRWVGGKPIATFVCTSCGFAYSRTGPDAENPLQLNRTKAYGTLWETRLQILWKDETASLRSIARQLGVGVCTVERQAMRIGLPFPRPVGIQRQQKELKRRERSCEQTRDPAIGETKRTQWLTLMQAHPGAGVSLLQSKEPRLYSWLYRNDKMWLSAHRPLYKKLKQPHSRVDWQARDLQLADKVRCAVLRLKDLPGRPVRISIASIGREIGQLTLLQQSLDSLPRTAEILREVVDTSETFAVRRVWWAMRSFSQEHIYPTRWQLMKRASVDYLRIWPEVKRALDTAMQILQRECQV